MADSVAHEGGACAVQIAEVVVARVSPVLEDAMAFLPLTNEGELDTAIVISPIDTAVKDIHATFYGVLSIQHLLPRRRFFSGLV